MKYAVVRTDTADEQIRKIILYINENFGSEAALQKLDELEEKLNRKKKNFADVITVFWSIFLM